MNQEKETHKPHQHAGRSSERLLNKEIILKELDIFPGAVILDAGCGNGYMSKEFSRMQKNSGKIFALDPDKNAIEILRQETPGTNITPILGDVTKTTDLQDSSIDLIYLSTVFHGFSRSQIDGFNKEVKRILKPKGILAIVEIKKEPTPFGPPLEIRFSPQELNEIIPLSPKKTVEVGQFFYLQLFENK
ncbi:class I SAM-dependent methyltransferase [Desulfobacca acetoxidans]|uniref:Methyltransferase type 11 n=1 Tax=Desulfobacca acetoxidans (strain ATCC 700848 / DSM 11109 / ASRB2) TaxID=880072 RepID=F2NIF5_DESAR|nr:class I SAM-dependent methyltransferase [Desulfobacca acetoxidans]AEB10357.1 Methyltransferase type 11 [Desulfobacca acetoxidans DSM 11109]